MTFLRIIMFLFSMSLVCSTFSQSNDYNMRDIVVTSVDSTVRCSIWNKEMKIKANPDCDYYWYYGEVINHNQGGYSGKLLQGKYEVFDYQQKLRTKGFFEKGVMVGEWSRWFLNGNLQFSGIYKNGKLQGVAKVYRIDGRLSSITTYNKGLPDGKAYFYGNDTVLTRIYKNGKEVVKLSGARKKDTKKDIRPSKQKEQVVTGNSAKPNESMKKEEHPKKKWWKLPFLKKDSTSTGEKK